MTEQELQQYLIKQYPKEKEGSPCMERQGRVASGRNSLQAKRQSRAQEPEE
ncbi:MAG: hypothetical protein IJ659_08130 [Alloprevotella sp.]|nr:hypothetical protein [Alloprevotella sp.]